MWECVSIFVKECVHVVVFQCICVQDPTHTTPQILIQHIDGKLLHKTCPQIKHLPTMQPLRTLRR